MLWSIAMALLTPLEIDDARRIGRSFALEVSSVAPVSGGSVNSNFRLETASGRAVFLRVYEEQAAEGALGELRTLGALARAGVPTPEPLLSRSGSLLEQHRGKPVALFPWVLGTILCQARVTPAHARAVGEALARVHLANVEARPGRFDRAALEARLERVAAVPAYAEVARDLAERLARLSARRDQSLPSGLVHGDLFRDNVLWQGEQIAALIDFESASQGVFVYDLMVCVLSWSYGSSFDLGLVRGLIQGYHAVRRLSAEERRGLELEGAMAALRFAITRITDYSLRAPAGKPPLRDYRRFVDRLAAVEAGALSGALEGLS